jgi:hypothetical protein
MSFWYNANMTEQYPGNDAPEQPKEDIIQDEIPYPPEELNPQEKVEWWDNYFKDLDRQTRESLEPINTEIEEIVKRFLLPGEEKNPDNNL